MAEMVSLENCLKKRHNLGHVVRMLESCVIGHSASMAVLKDDGNFRKRLEAAKARQLRRLLTEIFGSETVDKLDGPKMAMLGLSTFA